MTQTINERQNEPDFLMLARAASATHDAVAIVEGVRWAFAAVATAGFFVATSVSQVEWALPLLSLALALVSEIGAQVLVRYLSERAATIQEQFDVDVLGISKNKNHAELPVAITARLAATYKGSDKRIRDWYLDVRGIPSTIATALCQRQNLLWDSELRAEWAQRIAAVVGSYLAVGLLTSYIFDWSVRAFIAGWVSPALPLLVPAVTAFVMQRNAIRIRRKYLDELTSAIEQAAKSKTHKISQKRTRGIQDQIFETRRDAPRVPGWFYQLRKEKYELAFEVDAAGYRSRWQGVSE